MPTVRQAKPEVQGALDRDIIRRIVRAHINEVRHCYNIGLARDPILKGRVAVNFTIASDGKVTSSVVQESTARDPALGTCIAEAIKRWTFPRTEDGNPVLVSYPFMLEPDYGPAPLSAAERRQERIDDLKVRRQQAIEERREAAQEALQQRGRAIPYTGEMLEVMNLVDRGDLTAALARARAWRTRDPGDVLALLALGEVHEALKNPLAAARAYGSIIDLFPNRADLRRYAGARLERLGADGLALAIDTFAQAVEQRPDHPASHRLYAYALVKAGRPKEALAAILAGISAERSPSRFAGVDRILNEDAAILAAAAIAADPGAEKTITAQLAKHGLTPATTPSLRFVLNWETDANDVDFHITDSGGNKAWYAQRTLNSGGELFADVTTGYGPECFAIEGAAQAYPYALTAHYFSRGPMGYGMGKLQTVQHDGEGGLKFEERPFVIMKDQAFVKLGTITGPLK